MRGEAEIRERIKTLVNIQNLAAGFNIKIDDEKIDDEVKALQWVLGDVITYDKTGRIE